jgi:hypothetical protein
VDLTVETDFGAGALVVADEGRLAQVFLNLVINAAQSIPEGYVDRYVVRVRSRRIGKEIGKHEREVPTIVERRATAHRRGPVEQTERRVIADRSLVGDRTDLAVRRRRQRFEARRGLVDKLREGPGFAHPRNVTLSYDTVK